MKRLERLTWNGFLGINTKTDPYDAKDTQATVVDNFKLSRRVGSLIKAPGYATAILDGTQFTDSGIEGLTINAIAEFYPTHNDADAPYYIIQAGDASAFYVWDEDNAQWDELTGFTTVVDTAAIRFVKRSGALLALTGSGASNKPVLFTFTPDRFINAYETDGAASTKAPVSASLQGSIAETAKFEDITCLSFDTSYLFHVDEYGESMGFDKGITAAYRIAVQFDGAQWGPPSEVLYLMAAGDDDAQFSITIQVDAATYDQRITGFRIYRCKSYTGTDQDVFRRFKEISVDDIPTRQEQRDPTTFGSEPNIYIYDDDFPTYHKASKVGTAFTFIEETRQTVAEYKWEYQLLGVKSAHFDIDTAYDSSKFTYLLPIQKAERIGANNIVNVLDDGGLADGDYWITNFNGWTYYAGDYWYNLIDYDEDLTEQPEMYEDLGYVADESGYNLNYELAEIVGKRAFVARYHDGNESRNDLIRVSSISGQGTYDYDTFHANDVISLQEYGITEVVGLSSWRNNLIVFGREDIIIVSPTSGSAFGWSLYDTVQRVGLSAAKSLVKANGATYYINPNGPYVFRESSSELLPAIVDPDDWPIKGVSDISEAVGVLDNARDEVLFSFPSDALIYALDLIGGEWTRYSLPSGISAFCRTHDDTLLLAIGGTIYALSYDATRFGAADIVPEYRSKEIKHSDGLIAPYAFEVRYESDSDLTLNVYLDGALHTTRTLSSESTESYQLLPAATPCNRIQWGVTLSAEQAATNTSIEIRSFTLSYKPVVRV